MFSPFVIWYFLLLTSVFIVIAGGGFIYLFMGIAQLVTGYKEKNNIKKRAGWITTFIACIVLGISTSYYLYLIL